MNSSYEIMINRREAVVVEVVGGYREVVDYLEDPERYLVFGTEKMQSDKWRGRHIGWERWADAVIVRDDRFSDDPMPLI